MDINKRQYVSKSDGRNTPTMKFSMREFFPYLCLLPVMCASMMRGVYLQDTYAGILVDLPFPLNILREHALIFIGVGLAISLVSCILETSGSITKLRVVPGLVILFFIQVAASFKEYLVAGGGVVFILTLFAVTVNVTLLGHLLVIRRNALNYFFIVIQFAMIFLVLASFYAWRIVPHTTFWEGRFNGVAAHPVYAGIYGAIGVMVSFFFVTKGVGLTWRIGSGLIGIACLVLVGLSGTRSGLLMLAIFFSIDGLRYPKRLFIYAAGVTAGVVLFLVIAPSVIGYTNEESARVVSTHNTRIEVWLDMASQVLENPLTGSSDVMTHSESSYLLAGLRIGVLGVLLAIIVAFLIIRDVAGLRHGARLYDQRYLAAIWTSAAMLIAFLALSFIEGYWIQTANFHLIVFIFVWGLVYYDRKNQAFLLSWHGRPAR
jgi:hypothetical protein